jgi:hypothetical protein
MGRLDAARELVKRLRAVASVVVPDDLPYRNPEDRELFLSGLSLAAAEAGMSQSRRLAAILAADVAGYSRLMGGGRGRHARTPGGAAPRACSRGLASLAIEIAHFLSRRFEEAVPKFLRAIQETWATMNTKSR